MTVALNIYKQPICPQTFLHSPFFFLLGPLVFTSVVTCSTRGSSVFSTDIVRISKFFGSHFNAMFPKSPIVPILLCRNSFVRCDEHSKTAP